MIGREGVVAALCAMGSLLAACGSDDAPAALAASGAWARTTPTGATNGVIYLSLTTDVADTVVGASVSPSVAVAAELHHTSPTGGGSGTHEHGGSGGGEVASMSEIDELEVTPEVPLVFEPGSHHIMLVDLPEPLERGDHFDLTLELGSGRSVVVDVTVADNPPGT